MSGERKEHSGWILLGVIALLLIGICGTLITILASGVALITREVPTQPAIGSKDQVGLEETQAMLDSIEIPLVDPISLAQRFYGIQEIPRAGAESAVPIPLGEQHTFWAADFDTSEPHQVEATLVASSKHLMFWVDNRVDYRLEDVEKVVQRFENATYPTTRSFFGREGSPGQGAVSWISVLYARGLGSSAAGYFSPRDFYPQVVYQYSNEREMLYISADNVHLRGDYIHAVIAHEFQHMLHWHLDSDEDTWMNEGFAELSTRINSYNTSGFEKLYSLDTDIPLLYWPISPGRSGAHYGQAFLFLAYFQDRFGNLATQHLIASPRNGLKAVDETLAEHGLTDPLTGDPIDANDVFLDWAISLAVQNAEIEDGRYGMPSYPEAPRGSYSDQFDQCPLSTQKREVNQFGVDLIRIACQGEYKLIFEGMPSVKVVPADPHSGAFAFWSNRGNEADMTLTRAFDLRGVTAPGALTYWIWYELEDHYDYLYVEVSQDEGKTWEILTTPAGTGENPAGVAYGWAYNGISGGGENPSWIQEKVDLSRFAGQQILLRYEYITDGAVNGEGILLDDISIPALDYMEDFESGSGGWDAKGFVRLRNHVPQTYQLALLMGGETLEVQKFTVSVGEKLEIPFVLEGGISDVIFVVTASAQHSWQPAPYEIRIDP